MNTKHTPGPWRIGDAGLTIFGPKTSEPAPVSIVELPGPTPRVSATERRANALLIAKAPQLLKALHDITTAVGMDEVIAAKNQAIELLEELQAF